MLNIVIAHDHVIVEGNRIERPSRVSPSQWLAFWEYATTEDDE